MTLQLRPYQLDAVTAVYDYLRNHSDNPCVVIPTAGGKTPISATICKDAVTKWQGRVLILAHVKELLEQAADKLRAICPEVMFGVYSAGLKRRDTEHPVIIAGIQSVYKRACELDAFDLIIVDEAHLIPAEGEGMYRTFLAEAKVVNPRVRTIGLTATPFRLKSGMICGPDNILNAVCYEIGVKELIRDGYLCPLVTKAGVQKADTANLHVRAGEFVADEVESLMDSDELVESACQEIIEYTQCRKAVLVFASGVKHAQHIQRVLEKQHGQECGFVCGKTPAAERDEILARFRGAADDGLFQRAPLKYLVNVNVLTTGFDAPNIDCVAIVRPTMSPGLWYQCVGRGFRLHPGKKNCLAEGQRVLTDSGLVPIEKVTADMRVWDGIAFVSHGGSVCHGEQEVIDYAGLVATPDHKVWTKEGWKTFGECAVEQTPISITGSGGEVVREAEGHFRSGIAQGLSRQTAFARAVRNLRGAIAEMLHQPDASQGRLSKMRTSTSCPEVACTANIECEGPLRKPSQSQVPRLRGTGDRVPVRDAHRDGCMDSRESGAAPQHADRQDRQRRPLRAREPAVRDGQGEHAQHAAMSLRRRVWDILNAGPRHRFTCEDLLVSNCVVLDFGGNALRHGPVDQIRIQERAGGGNGSEAPAKECPECHALIAAGYSACPDCGYEFPARERANHDAEASTEGVLSGQVTNQQYTVRDVLYTVHTKRGADDDAPKTMRVDYKVGWHEFKSEWVCFEHNGYARWKAEQWWLARSHDPIPDTAEQAVNVANAGGLAPTKTITVRTIAGEPYERIVDYDLGEKPEAAPVDEGRGPCEDIPF